MKLKLITPHFLRDTRLQLYVLMPRCWGWVRQWDRRPQKLFCSLLYGFAVACISASVCGVEGSWLGCGNSQWTGITQVCRWLSECSE